MSRAAAAHVYVPDVPGAVELIRRAEALGVRGLWLSGGGLGPDSLTALAVIGAATDRILLGTSIAITFARHPLAMAQQALAIAQVAPGRFRLGLGTSHRPTIEAVYGLPFDRPLEHLREYVSVVRRALSGERVDHDGRRFRVHARLAAPADVPIYVSALRPRSYELAGAIADGAISWVTPPEFLRDVAGPAMRRAAGEAGRPVPRLVGHAFGLVTDDAASARVTGRERLVGYTRLPFYQEMFAAAGHPEARDGFLTEDLVDALALVGSEDRVAAGIRPFFESGVDELILTLLPGSDQETDRTLRLLAAIA